MKLADPGPEKADPETPKEEREKVKLAPALLAGNRQDGRSALHFAAVHGWEEECLRLVDSSAPLSDQDAQGNTPLHLAAARGAPQLVEKLLALGAPSKVLNAEGRSPLCVACKAQQWTAVPLAEAAATARFYEPDSDRAPDGMLIQTEIRPTGRWRSVDARGPLHWAAKYNLVTVVRNLITENEEGECLVSSMEINARDNEDMTALRIACSYGHDLVVRELLRCPWIDTASFLRGTTCLHLAASRLQAKTCFALLDHPSIDVDAVDRGGCTALHLACAESLEDVGLELLNARCSVMAEDSDGATPMLLACASPLSMPRIVHALLELGADPDVADRYGRLPLMEATKAGHSLVCKELVSFTEPLRPDQHAEIILPPRVRGIATESITQALQWAAQHGEREVVAVLAPAAASADIASALVHCFERGRHGVAETLLKAAPRPLPDIEDFSALGGHAALPVHWAARIGSEPAALLLLEFAGDLKAAELDDEGLTALHWAALGGHEKLCNELLTYHSEAFEALPAGLSHLDDHGRTARQYAYDTNIVQVFASRTRM